MYIFMWTIPSRFSAQVGATNEWMEVMGWDSPGGRIVFSPTIIAASVLNMTQLVFLGGSSSLGGSTLVVGNSHGTLVFSDVRMIC